MAVDPSALPDALELVDRDDSVLTLDVDERQALIECQEPRYDWQQIILFHRMLFVVSIMFGMFVSPVSREMLGIIIVSIGSINSGLCFDQIL